MSSFTCPLVSLGASQHGWAPLHVAAYYGHADTVGVLLASGAGISLKDPLGATPLALARDQRHTEVEVLLRAAGAVE